MDSKFKSRFGFGHITFYICLGTAFVFSWGVTYAKTKESNSAWQAPASAEKVKNPITSDSKSTDLGKKVYTAKCLSCHGTQGKGDGPMFKVLKTKPGDLSGAQVKAETDGALFWKITFKF